MSVPNSEYLAQVSSRIVRMFQMYTQNINPEDELFQAFISNYVAQRGVKDIQAVPYSQLYKAIKEGIREYLRIQERVLRSEK